MDINAVANQYKNIHFSQTPDGWKAWNRHTGEEMFDIQDLRDDRGFVAGWFCGAACFSEEDHLDIYLFLRQLNQEKT